MKKIITFLLFFSLVIFQLTIVPYLTVFSVYPNILIGAVLIFAIFKNSNWVLLWALLAGLMLDFFSSLPLGIYSLNFILIAWLAMFVGRNIFKITDLLGQVSLLLLGCFLFSFLNIFLIKVFYWFGLSELSLPFSFVFWRTVLPEIILNSLSALAIFIIFKIFALKPAKNYGLYYGTKKGI